jgi:hypothetical protein
MHKLAAAAGLSQPRLNPLIKTMRSEAKDERLLNNIIVYGFSLAFGLVVASSQALRRVPTGFAIVLSWWTLIALMVGAALTFPFFVVIVHSQRKTLRRVALTFVCLLGLGAFFYPMRVVPRENFRPVFIGLAAAVGALSVMGGSLLLLYRFFERDEKSDGNMPRQPKDPF